MKKYIGILLVAMFGILSSYKVTDAQFISVVLSLTGNVIDLTTQEPLSMRLEAFDKDGNRIYYGRTKAENDGYYFITGLKPNKKYTLRFSDNDEYQDYEEVVAMPDVDKYQEIEKEIRIVSNAEIAQPGK